MLSHRCQPPSRTLLRSPEVAAAQRSPPPARGPVKDTPEGVRPGRRSWPDGPMPFHSRADGAVSRGVDRPFITAVTTRNGQEPESGVHGEVLVNCPDRARTFPNR
jgi:hypothetical protein